MKKVFKFILLIAEYFILCIFNNVRSIMVNGKTSLFTQGMLYTGPMIFSGIILLLMFIFSEKLKDYKKIKISSMLVMFSFALMNGIFPDKQISRYIILYFIMLMNSIFITKVLKEKFELSIFISSSLILLISIPFAMLNILKVYKVILIVFEFLVCAYLLYELRKKSFTEEIKEKINTPSLIVFSVMFILLALGGVNRYVHVWDEYSHWAFDAKAVISNEKLTTQQEVVSATRSYPPLLSLWHYLNSIVLDFNEENLYIWLAIYSLVCFMPAFAIIKEKNKWIMPLFAVVLLFSTKLFDGIYFYTSLYADFATVVTFLNVFIIYFIYKDNANDFKKMKRYLFLPLAMSTLIKPSGIIASFVFFVIVFIDEFIKRENSKLTVKNIWDHINKFLKRYFKLGMSIVMIFVLWNVYVKVCDITVEKFYNEKILPVTLETGIKYKLNATTIGKMLYNLFKSLDSSLFNGFSLYQCLLLFPVIIYFFVVTKHKCTFKQAVIKMVPYIVGAIVFYALTFLAIFVTFSAYEAGNLASFVRYVNNFNIAIYLLAIIYICKEDFLKDKKGRVVSVVTLVAILVCLKITDLTYFVSDYKTRQNTREISIERQEKVKAVNEYTDENSKVYVLDQQDKDGIMAMWYARYYCFPRKINAYSTSINWKIRTQKNVDDLQDWGLTASRLEEHLLKYDFDYIFFYTADDEMFENMKDMFEDYDTCKNYSLFKIEEKNGKALLVGVV